MTPTLAPASKTDLDRLQGKVDNLERFIRVQLGLVNPASIQRPQPFEQGLQTNTITSPNGVLQLFHGLAFPSQDITLVNGANQDVDVGVTSSPSDVPMVYVRILGPTLPFSIGGFTGGVNGRLLLIQSTVTSQITINNQDAGSTAGNRINTLTGGNVNAPNVGSGNALILLYAVGAWTLFSIQ